MHEGAQENPTVNRRMAWAERADGGLHRGVLIGAEVFGCPPLAGGWAVASYLDLGSLRAFTACKHLLRCGIAVMVAFIVATPGAVEGLTHPGYGTLWPAAALGPAPRPTIATKKILSSGSTSLNWRNCPISHVACGRVSVGGHPYNEAGQPPRSKIGR